MQSINQKIRTSSKQTALVNTRRDQIRKAAAKLFTKKGYHSTTIRDIAKLSGMSIGQLYHYIGSKEDILYLFLEDFMKGILQITRTEEEYTSATEALKHAIDGLCHLVDNDKNEFVFAYSSLRLLSREASADILKIDQQGRELFEKILTKGVKNGEFEIDNVGVAALTIITVGHMWAIRSWALKDTINLQDYIDVQTQLIIKSLSKPKS